MTTEYTLPQGISYSLEMITPDLAASFLEMNTKNRNLKRKNVDSIVVDILTGEWRLTGNAISFDDTGALLDGQHRLQAIVEANIAVPCFVVLGLPSETMEVIDAGVKRTLADALHLRGVYNANNAGATIRGVYIWTRHGNPGVSVSKPSNSVMLRLFESDEEAFVQATKDGVRISNNTPITASIASTCAYFFRRASNELADEFIEMLCSGFHPDGSGLDKDHPISQLRHRFLADASSPNPSLNRNRKLCSALIVKAWNAFVEGRKIGVLRYRAGGANPEPFPEVSVPDGGTGIFDNDDVVVVTPSIPSIITTLPDFQADSVKPDPKVQSFQELIKSYAKS